MNAELALASVLRSVSGSIEELPTEFVADVLDSVADGLETPKNVHRVFVHTSCDGACDKELAGEAAGTAPAASAPLDAAPADAASDEEAAGADEDFEEVTEGEIQAGDQWKLKPGLRHKDNKPVQWREVTEDLLGEDIEDFEKSIFRRKKTAVEATSTETEAFADVTEGTVKAGDQWKLKAGLRHKDRRPVEWRTVTADLVGRDVTSFGKSIFRRPVAEAATAVASAAEFVGVTSGNVVAGDQWKLKAGLRHRGGRSVEWREVTADHVGRPIADFAKSDFRRKA